jgi:hypothetical protein
MKKWIVAFLLLLSVSSFGQSFTQSIFKRLSFGVKAGANYSNFYHADFSTDALIGFHAGALVNFKLTNQLSIQEEFLFSSLGAKIKDGVLGGETAKLYYLSVPFLLKYCTSFGLYLEAGPQMSIRLTENVPDRSGNFAQQLDSGLAGGLGFQSKSGLEVGIRYCAGLSNVAAFEVSNSKPEFKNNVFQASLSYTF